MSAYRKCEVDVELERPAPWWKRVWLRAWAWWRVTDLFGDGMAQHVRNMERMEALIKEMDRVRDKADGAIAANLAAEQRAEVLIVEIQRRHGKPPPLPVPGPGRDRLG